MQFPKRTPEHVKESTSWKILQSNAPSQWIIREITERDYGIDAYVELASGSGEVTGELCSIQLKGAERVNWKMGESCDLGEARLSGIPIATVNYWMHLPMPVFLVWADIEAGKAYFAAVKDEVRNQYDRYTTQETLSFSFASVLELGTELGRAAFRALYFKEKHFKPFQDALRGLMIHWEEYLEFIRAYQCRDEHLGIELDEQLMLVHLYKSCILIARFLDVNWNVPDIADVYRHDRKRWNDPYYFLHQHSMADIMKPLETVFVETLRKAKKLVTEQGYWKKTEPALFLFWSMFKLDSLKEV